MKPVMSLKMKSDSKRSMNIRAKDKIGWRWYKCNYSIAFTESLSPAIPSYFVGHYRPTRERTCLSMVSNYKEASNLSSIGIHQP